MAKETKRYVIVSEDPEIDYRSTVHEQIYTNLVDANKDAEEHVRDCPDEQAIVYELKPLFGHKMEAVAIKLGD